MFNAISFYIAHYVTLHSIHLGRNFNSILLILFCFYFLYSVCLVVGIWLKQVGPWQVSGNNQPCNSSIVLSHLWHVLNAFQIKIELTILTSYVLVPLFLCIQSLPYLIVTLLSFMYWLPLIFLLSLCVLNGLFPKARFSILGVYCI